MAKILGAQIPEEIKNLAINGNFDFWQRVEANTQTVNTASTVNTVYTADMFTYNSGGTTNKNYSVAQSSNVPTIAQSGFVSTFSYLFTMITGISSFAAGDYVEPIQYRMEGYDFSRIHQKTVTYGFWAYASVAGTYNFVLRNGANNRSYVTTFTISGSNTWQFITISVQMDTAGTYTFTNNVALTVDIGCFTGSSFQTSTLGSWQTGTFLSANTATNWMATTGAVFQIAQFSIVEGPLGFSATGFQRIAKAYQQELSMCERYYEKSYAQGTAPQTITQVGMLTFVQPLSAVVRIRYMLRTEKRTMSPTVNIYPTNGAFANNTISHDVTANQAIGSLQADGKSVGWEIASNTSSDDRSYWHYVCDAGL